jgi:hypothetical protein
MSQKLDCRYTGGDRRVIRLTADLDQGWQDLGSEWGVDSSGFLNYEIGSKFQCRVRFVAKAPETWASRTAFPVSEYITRLSMGNNGVMIWGSSLLVDVPLDQPWRPAADDPEQPSIYAAEPSLTSIETPDGKIEYQLEVWMTHEGIVRRFAKHDYAWGSGFAWSGRA